MKLFIDKFRNINEGDSVVKTIVLKVGFEMIVGESVVIRVEDKHLLVYNGVKSSDHLRLAEITIDIPSGETGSTALEVIENLDLVSPSVEYICDVFDEFRGSFWFFIRDTSFYSGSLDLDVFVSGDIYNKRGSSKFSNELSKGEFRVFSRERVEDNSISSGELLELILEIFAILSESDAFRLTIFSGEELLEFLVKSGPVNELTHSAVQVFGDWGDNGGVFTGDDVRTNNESPSALILKEVIEDIKEILVSDLDKFSSAVEGSQKVFRVLLRDFSFKGKSIGDLAAVLLEVIEVLDSFRVT
jgi:hypothetical protein